MPCVLNARTRCLLGVARLALMKPAVFLVKVSRSKIVDESALLQRRLAGAALDVDGREPLSRQSHQLPALFAMGNVMPWPHPSVYRQEAMQRLEDETPARCFEALRGQPLSVASLDPRLRARTRGVRFVRCEDLNSSWVVFCILLTISKLRPSMPGPATFSPCNLQPRPPR